MDKILQSTSRGQVTLPKDWRDQYDTHYFAAEVKGDMLIIKPLIQDDLEKSVEKSWDSYTKGNYITHEELMGKYGL